MVLMAVLASARVSRAERLLELMQVLRRHRSPVTASALVEELGVSLRTLYRDIATLRSQGADILGEPGMGYVLRPGFTLPPLMFSIEELEALVLGTRWVARRTDDRSLGVAARNAIAKISSVLPAELRREVHAATLMVGPEAPHTSSVDSAMVREAIRREHKLTLGYRDAEGDETQRTIWPFAIGFFERARVVVAWCELRKGFRHFRMDRVVRISPTQTPYPRGRQVLLQEWFADQGIVTADEN